jgi:predicted nucleic acid-binding protein
MQTQVLDTNVLVRYLVRDVPEQYHQAERWFKEAESGDREIFITAPVIAETVFVLQSIYQKSFTDIAEALRIFINQRWLKVEQRELLDDTLEIYGKGKHFIDSYLLAMKRTFGFDILTFDKKLKRQL